MKDQIRLLIADDHPMFLDGVKNVISQLPQINLVASCVNGDEVVEVLSSTPVDIALLDINMPYKNGVELASIIATKYAHIKVILLSMLLPKDVEADNLWDLGIAGYILKNSGSEILKEAILTVSAGKKYIDASIGEINIESFNIAKTNPVKLSSREKEILKLLLEGKSNKDIATELFLSELTIKTHRKNIQKKLGTHSIAELFVAAKKLKLDYTN